MSKKYTSFNDIPICLTYKIGEKKEYQYQPIIFPESPDKFIAMYALVKDGIFEKGKRRFIFEDFLFCVSGSTFEEAGNRLAQAFEKEPVKSRVSGNEWLLIPTDHLKKEKGFDMDEHVRPETLNEGRINY